METEKKLHKNRKFYECKLCNYNTRKTLEYNKHLSTQKHINRQKLQTIQTNYECKDCDYNTCKKTDFNKHLITQKHINRQKIDKKLQINRKKYECKECFFSTDKKTDYNKHLLTKKHLDIVAVIDINIIDIKDDNNKNNIFFDPDYMKTMFMEIIKNQSVLQNKMFEITSNQLITNNSTLITSNSNNVNNNNQFNLNFFLNETCKDAMNIDEFINTLSVTMEDFETTGNIGYIEGITRIILNGLKKIDTTKRPVHCTDVKRETVYIKSDNSWEKENEDKKQLKKAVKQVAKINLSQLPKWQRENPASEILDTREHGQFMKYSMAALGGLGEREEEKFIDKIMKNVIKEVTIDKNNGNKLL